MSTSIPSLGSRPSNSKPFSVAHICPDFGSKVQSPAFADFAASLRRASLSRSFCSAVFTVKCVGKYLSDKLEPLLLQIRASHALGWWHQSSERQTPCHRPADNGMPRVDLIPKCCHVSVSLADSGGASAVFGTHIISPAMSFFQAHGKNSVAVIRSGGGGKSERRKRCVRTTSPGLFSELCQSEECSIDRHSQMARWASSISRSTRSAGTLTNRELSIRYQRLEPQALFQLLAKVRCQFFDHTLTSSCQQAPVRTILNWRAVNSEGCLGRFY